MSATSAGLPRTLPPDRARAFLDAVIACSECDVALDGGACSSHTESAMRILGHDDIYCDCVDGQACERCWRIDVLRTLARAVSRVRSGGPANRVSTDELRYIQRYVAQSGARAGAEMSSLLAAIREALDGLLTERERFDIPAVRVSDDDLATRAIDRRQGRRRGRRIAALSSPPPSSLVSASRAPGAALSV